MKQWLLILSFFCVNSLSSYETISISGNPIVRLTLEHATTTPELTWGLMQREYLPKNHGMTFSYPTPKLLSFWSFNCLVNLSVAFLDSHKVIRNIHALNAYPEKMDPKRPVDTYEDLAKYPQNDPILRFFSMNSARSSFLCKYALEMEQGWFEENDIHIGDAVIFSPHTRKGFIIRTLDVAPYMEREPVLFSFSQSSPRSIWSSSLTKGIEVAFLDNSGNVITKKCLLPHQAGFPQVAICQCNAKSALVTPLK